MRHNADGTFTVFYGSQELCGDVPNRLDVTAGISIHHLTLNEIDVGDYRTFFKLTPPLRSEEDRLEMVQAVADGTIEGTVAGTTARTSKSPTSSRS